MQNYILPGIIRNHQASLLVPFLSFESCLKCLPLNDLIWEVFVDKLKVVWLQLKLAEIDVNMT